jgi:hypothetical protein
MLNYGTPQSLQMGGRRFLARVTNEVGSRLPVFCSTLAGVSWMRAEMAVLAALPLQSIHSGVSGPLPCDLETLGNNTPTQFVVAYNLSKSFIHFYAVRYHYDAFI